MISTPICDMLGIRYPIFQGGMAWISDGKLAGAVSEAGAWHYFRYERKRRVPARAD